METRKLKSLPYGQAHIDVSDDGNIETLVSYETVVLVKMKNFQDCGRTAYRLNGLYSRTTIKHISLYLREEGISYYYLKPCANTEWLLIIANETDPFNVAYYNQETGEWYSCQRIGDFYFLKDKYYTKINLDGEKYSDLIYHDGTEMKGYYRW